MTAPIDAAWLAVLEAKNAQDCFEGRFRIAEVARRRRER
jgi:hypothetical protein